MDEAFILAGGHALGVATEQFTPLNTAGPEGAANALHADAAVERVACLTTFLRQLTEFRLMRILRGSRLDERKEILRYTATALRLVHFADPEIGITLAAKRAMLRWSHEEILTMARTDLQGW